MKGRRRLASGWPDRAAIRSSSGCFVFAFPFPHQMREQGAAHATATEHAASDEKAQHPALFVLAFAAFILALALAFVLVFFLAVLAQEMGEENTADAAATQHSARD
jgi:hypothetical protein